MFVYGLSRKQCGVIFANIKNGNLTLCDEFSKWMYNSIADCKAFMNNSTMADVFARMKSGLELVFAHNYDAASEELSAAFTMFHACYN